MYLHFTLAITGLQWESFKNRQFTFDFQMLALPKTKQASKQAGPAAFSIRTFPVTTPPARGRPVGQGQRSGEERRLHPGHCGAGAPSGTPGDPNIRSDRSYPDSPACICTNPTGQHLSPRDFLFFRKGVGEFRQMGKTRERSILFSDFLC